MTPRLNPTSNVINPRCSCLSPAPCSPPLHCSLGSEHVTSAVPTPSRLTIPTSAASDTSEPRLRLQTTAHYRLHLCRTHSLLLLQKPYFTYGKQRCLLFSYCHSSACKYQTSVSLDSTVLVYPILKTAVEATDLDSLNTKTNKQKSLNEFWLGRRTDFQ